MLLCRCDVKTAIRSCRTSDLYARGVDCAYVSNVM
jgi:hypothetical protein